MTSPLFEPFHEAGLRLPNRIVMAPMTRRFCPGGVPTAEVSAYYTRRAGADVGLIVTEGTWINHPSASNSQNVPRFYGQDALTQWRQIARDVHAVGGRIIPQLWHVGALVADSTSDTRTGAPISPSGFYDPGEMIAEPMRQSDIDVVIDAYATAAADAQKLGFDGAEFHGAHGYLIDQFLWDATNQRTDGYGGNLRERTRFAVEMIEECRRRVGPDFPLILRISQFKAKHFDYKFTASAHELADLVEPLAEAGVSIFHCSQRRFWEAEYSGSSLNFAGWVKKLSGRPTIAVGSVGLNRDGVTALYLDPATPSRPASLERLEEMLDRKEFDLVAVGRALLKDPYWAEKIRNNKTSELQTYDAEALKTLY
jgi:2,4-dienoyl-CoA reductase-like NADH-dependent reductase (Old Yellow Enzyme family)